MAGTCARCGGGNLAEARFCMHCGAPLEQSSRIRPLPPDERRRVTVLFADIVGYTPLSERLDPEAVKEFSDRCLRRLAAEVEAYGGDPHRFSGDSVMALWGAPRTLEDDAERAVRCGLAMQQAMDSINDELKPFAVTLALRVGINSGEVLAGSVGGSYTVSGDSVNTAQRLQSVARPGTVTIGESTFATTRHVIDYICR